MTTLAIHGDMPLRAADIRSQVNLIQEVMRDVMHDKEHFGVIPGCKKPSLWKPGAEKIMATFRIAARPVVEDLSGPDEIRYRVTVEGSSSSGAFLGAGIGECSSNEEKYKWRAPKPQEFENTPDDRRRIKYENEGPAKQVRTNPSDVANTVLKMAKKRGLVDMVLTVTAASDIFTQDIEDMEDAPTAEAKPTVQEPQRKSAPKPVESKQAETPQADPSGDAFPASHAESMVGGETARVRGVLSWDAEPRKTANGKDQYTFKLKHDGGGQPVSFSHWGEMPDGLKKGVTVEFDCKANESGGKTYRNAEKLVICQ
jgi:hypothetical protein